MSNALLNLAWEVRGLSRTQKLVLVRLADRADARGLCYPSESSIARDCALSRRSVGQAIASLLVCGQLHLVTPARFHFPATYRVSPGFGAARADANPLPISDTNGLPTSDANAVPTLDANGLPISDAHPLPISDAQRTPKRCAAHAKEMRSAFAQTLSEPSVNLQSPPIPPKGGAGGGGPSEPPGTGRKPSSGRKKSEAAQPGFGAVLPTDEEVFAFGAAYPGNLALGIGPQIPKKWLAGWIAYWSEPRRGAFPQDWRRNLLAKYRADWLAKHPNTWPEGASGRPGSILDLKTRLAELRDQAASHPTNPDSNNYDPELAKDPEVRKAGAALRAEIRRVVEEMRKT